MNKSMAFVFMLIAPLYLGAAEPIDLTFSGELILPSCNIDFSDGSNIHMAEFGEVNVSDTRYYKPGEADINNFDYSQELPSAVFYVRISGCTSASLNADSDGKQFTFTIDPGPGSEWVNGDVNDYMSGSLTPTEGEAKDFGAKILVPYTGQTSSESPTKWSILTGAGVTNARADGNRTDVVSVTRSFAVAFSDLKEKSNEDGSSYWLMPMRVNLGMLKPPVTGMNMGQFSVSGILTTTYY